MSDNPQADPAVVAEIAAITNEYRRLQRQIEAKTQALDAMLAPNGPGGAFPVDFLGIRPRRYSVDFTFSAGNVEDTDTAGIGGGPQENSVNVDVGTIFRCAYVESFVRVVGNGSTSDEIQATLPPDQRLRLFDFFWRIRDTGSDRDWCDRPQPSQFLGGGAIEPLWLPRALPIGGGTALHVQIDPTVSVSSFGDLAPYFAGGEVSSYNVIVSFVGHEVPDRSTP